jgi:thioredoxin-like negative regulator of GroEL
MGSRGATATEPRTRSARATLVFVRLYSSGASRRMESLVAWVKVTQKRRLDVLELDADRHSSLVAKLGVTSAPSLVLVKDSRVVGRLEGRASGRQIDDLIRPHLQ